MSWEGMVFFVSLPSASRQASSYTLHLHWVPRDGWVGDGWVGDGWVDGRKGEGVWGG